MSGRLYIVATPIGNLGDMTPRAVEILREVDIIAAEDTQNSMTLMAKFEIKTKLVSNHKFNESGSADYFINELLSGKNIAVISDAGTPCISDPGNILVKRAVENNIEIVGIPGACAAVTAVSISGFDIKSFIFEGFFPRENTEIKKIIKKLKDNPGVYIFYESPKRIIKAFEFFSEAIPECNICLCNDLTKKFEKIYRGSPAKVLEELRDNPSAEKGEYTIVVEITEIVGDGVPDVPEAETEIVDLDEYVEEDEDEEIEDVGDGALDVPESEDDTITIDDNTLTIITVTKKGLGKRCEFEKFTRRNRGGKGMACHKISEKTGELVGALSVLETDDIMIITDDGTMIRTPVSGIPVYNNRAAGGVKVMKTSEGVSIKSVIRVAAAETEEEENEEVVESSENMAVVEVE